MTLWLVRAGEHGEREDFNLENNVVSIGWESLNDLAELETREELKEILVKVYPDFKPAAIPNFAGQIWSFKERIEIGDMVVLPLKSSWPLSL